MTYYLFLPKTNEYIMETNSENIWLKTKDINEAFTTSYMAHICSVGHFICKGKFLIPNVELVVLEEEIVLHKQQLLIL